jgi:ribonuclease HII
MMTISFLLVSLLAQVLYIGLSCCICPVTSLASNKRQLPLRKRSLKDALQIEEGLYKRGFRYIIGSDESGTGCIAGPIVTASCCCVTGCASSSRILIEGVDDAKRLTRTLRRDIYQVILDHPDHFAWAVATRSNQVIDELSLEQATKECFQESIENVVQQIKHTHGEAVVQEQDDQSLFYSICDGHKSQKLISNDSRIPSRAWKAGDEVVYTVALASIIARCHHEQIMEDMALQYKGYWLEDNEGYPSRQHIEALHAHGPSPVHRQSCKPVKDRRM